MADPTVVELQQQLQGLTEQLSGLHVHEENDESSQTKWFTIKLSSSRVTVKNATEVWLGNDPLKALILNLEASEKLSNKVNIPDVNEYEGEASLSIPKVPFVKRQVKERDPHFIGISEVKNKNDRAEIQSFLNRKGFGTKTFDFGGEILVHGWKTSEYVIDNDAGNEPTDGHGFRYIWTRLKRKDDENKKFILVTCHMPKKNTTSEPELLQDSWTSLMDFIRNEQNDDVPILLMGDTNAKWAAAGRRDSWTLQRFLSLGNEPAGKRFPHLALDENHGNPATTIGGSFIDNFIFFYKDGENHEDFTKNYCVDYHRLGWTSHHVLVFKFNRGLLGLEEPTNNSSQDF